MKRLALPDLLKGFAVFFMIQVHIMELFINEAGRESLTGKISMMLGGPLAAPVFLIVMGYFISMSKKSTFQILRRGVSLFLLGVLLNIGLNFNLLAKIMFSGWQYNPLEYILGADFLFLAGTGIIFLAIFKKIKKLPNYAFLILVTVILMATPFLNHLADRNQEENFILPFIAGNYSWSYFPVFPWLAYPLAGFWFQKSESHFLKIIIEKRNLAVAGFIVILTLVSVFSVSGFHTSINLPLYYHHSFTFFLWTIGLIIIWTLLLRVIVINAPHSKLLNFIGWTGKNVTLIYVIQWLITGNIATEIYRTQPITGFIWWFAGISVFCFVLVCLFELIKKFQLIIN